MFTLMIEAFDEAVLGGAAPAVPASDAWHNMRAIDACFDAIRTGRRVAIPAGTP
jgi:predicted dehydrogenase